jgi:hypothetical protein
LKAKELQMLLNCLSAICIYKQLGAALLEKKVVRFFWVSCPHVRHLVERFLNFRYRQLSSRVLRDLLQNFSL